MLEAELSGQERKIYYEACAGTPFISCIIEEDSGPLWSETSLIRSALLIICLFLVAMLPLTRVLVTMLTRPLAKLSESMLRFSRGDYNAKADFRYGDDIGRLGRVFNHMVEENRRLVELNYVLKLQEKEAELSMLQMQINPHFLYNMLNTAYWCALKNKDEPTAGIMYKLGSSSASAWADATWAAAASSTALATASTSCAITSSCSSAATAAASSGR